MSKSVRVARKTVRWRRFLLNFRVAPDSPTTCKTGKNALQRMISGRSPSY